MVAPPYGPWTTEDGNIYYNDEMISDQTVVNLLNSSGAYPHINW